MDPSVSSQMIAQPEVLVVEIHCTLGRDFIPSQKECHRTHATSGSQPCVLFPLRSASEEDQRFLTHHQPERSQQVSASG